MVNAEQASTGRNLVGGPAEANDARGQRTGDLQEVEVDVRVPQQQLGADGRCRGRYGAGAVAGRVVEPKELDAGRDSLRIDEAVRRGREPGGAGAAVIVQERSRADRGRS